ncbi:hypothetical protein LCGC14_0477160 [marine sediment metagenome]|uniref:Uncharacterized protein n=1 Tax=marine sediment metagenome TaxID=412755 RepID=A0A0F9SFS8_9ZZZZ
MNKDFDLFQKEYKKWQRRFGLTGYTVYFKYEPIGTRFAQIGVDFDQQVATVSLNSELPKDNEPFKDIKLAAKHEAIHLLLGQLEFIGKCRYVQPEEFTVATENLTNKLEELIKD